VAAGAVTQPETRDINPGRYMFKSFFGKALETVAEHAVKILLTSYGVVFLAFAKRSALGVRNYLVADHALAGWLIFLFGLASTFSVAEIFRWIARRLLARREHSEKYLEFGGYRWEVSSEFLFGGYKHSSEECSPGLIRQFFKGPLCKDCLAECFRFDPSTIVGIDKTTSVVNPCPVCGEHSFSGTETGAGSADILRANAFRHAQASIRKRESAAKILNLPRRNSQKTRRKIDYSQDSANLFFYNRMCAAFAGQRGVIEASGEDAVNRLSLLLEMPVADRGNGPIWKIIGGISTPIRNFKSLSNNKILIDEDEYIVRKLIAYRRDNDYWHERELVYVEYAADKPTGLYSMVGDEEAYAIFDGHNITREQFDDGAMFQDGRSIRISNAEPRCRHLAPGAFMLASSDSALATGRIEGDLAHHLEKIRAGQLSFNEFARMVDRIQTTKF
jgi:hypothetical protein